MFLCQIFGLLFKSYMNKPSRNSSGSRVNFIGFWSTVTIAVKQREMSPATRFPDYGESHELDPGSKAALSALWYHSPASHPAGNLAAGRVVSAMALGAITINASTAKSQFRTPHNSHMFQIQLMNWPYTPFTYCRLASCHSFGPWG